MTFGRHTLAAASLLALLAAAGCSDDPEPKFAPSPSPSPSSSSAAPQAEPWEKQSEAGAVAFAKHWVDVFNEAQRSGDTTAMRAMSTDTCGTCSNFARMLERLYGSGGSIESKGWSVLQSVPTKDLPQNLGRVTLRVGVSAQVVRHGDDKPDEKFPDSKVTLSARTMWKDGAWVMNDLVALE